MNSSSRRFAQASKLQDLDDAELDEVSGGFLPVIYGAAAAVEVFAPGLLAAGAAGAWAVASNPAQVVRGITNGIDTLSRAGSAIGDYLNPSPGHGAPGDSYVPATANADGSVNPGHFEAPGASGTANDAGSASSEGDTTNAGAAGESTDHGPDGSGDATGSADGSGTAAGDGADHAGDGSVQDAGTPDPGNGGTEYAANDAGSGGTDGGGGADGGTGADGGGGSDVA